MTKRIQAFLLLMVFSFNIATNCLVILSSCTHENFLFVFSICYLVPLDTGEGDVTRADTR